MVGADRDEVALLANGFGAAAAGLVRVEAEIPHEVPSRIGNVLGELGDEVQRVEDLEVAGNIAEEVAAGGPGEATSTRPTMTSKKARLSRSRVFLEPRSQSVTMCGLGGHVL